jgi:hypothetical protein
MPVADLLIDSTSSNKVISFLDGNAGYNQIFMAKEDVSKTAFRCPGFIGLFESVVITFGLKTTSAYQRAMNLIFHDLLGVLTEVYINDVVVKSVGFEEHIPQEENSRANRLAQQVSGYVLTQGVFWVTLVSLVENRYALRSKGKLMLEKLDRLQDKTDSG